uniref:AlNc14C358G10962 protein n=1 Tax=Albugo laibachii Nc14 TaxID=890382 RepID=F0WXL1_9STRA|nr:AlNc14C358G10962 [Albugo laibachii Nc14]|eukprot:CCA26205.1 AlNc14C358G10962 [Albugo laibachii Nc14]
MPFRDQSDMSIHTNAKGWWNGGLSVEFLTFHFGGRAATNDRILLLWDDFSGHWTAKVRECAKFLNVVLVKLPPHSTAVSQAADVAWNFTFKSNLRRLLAGLLAIPSSAVPQRDWIVPISAAQASNDNAVFWSHGRSRVRK